MGNALDISGTKETISDEGANQFNGRLVAKGTVLLSFKLSVGKVGIAAVPMYTNEAIAALTIRDPSALFSRYLMRYLQFADLVGGADRAAMGNTLNLSKLRAIPISLPPLSEQRRIAQILDQVTTLYSLGEQRIESLRSLHESLFVSWFGHPSQAPVGSELQRIDEIASTRLGKMLDGARQTGESKKRYLRNTNVQWLEFDLSSIYEMDFSEADQATYALLPGDVLVCEGGQPGRCAIWKGQIEDIFFQKALHRVRLDTSRMLPEVFARTMKMLVEGGYLSESISSATIAHLTGEKLRAIEIPVPPIDRQREYVRRATAIDKLVETHKAQLLLLDELFASLQHRAFNGELYRAAAPSNVGTVRSHGLG